MNDQPTEQAPIRQNEQVPEHFGKPAEGTAPVEIGVDLAKPGGDHTAVVVGGEQPFEASDTVAAIFERLASMAMDGISEDEAHRILAALEGPTVEPNYTVVWPFDDFDKYARFVERGVLLEDDSVRERLMLCGLGLSGEAGEVTDHLKKYAFHGKPVDSEKIILELGDVLWYYTLLLMTLGVTWDQVIAGNVEKLTNRYPETHNV